MPTTIRHLAISLFIATALGLLSALPSLAETKKVINPEDFRTCSQEMEITDIQFSSRASMGLELAFDDIGCAVIWRNIQGALDQTVFDAKATVRDFNNLSTVIMSEAFYVLDKKKLSTPLGFGIAAFKEKKAAKSLIKKNGSGTLLTFYELIKLDLIPPEPPEAEEEEEGEKKK